MLASPERALLWECEGGCDLLVNWSATYLNDTILHCSDFWSIRQAHDINDDGWIIGWADANEGGPADFRAVILFPDQNCQVCCFADLDCDGNVDVPDLLILLGSWGPCLGCPADLDCDGTVGSSDKEILLDNWGPCAGSDGGSSHHALEEAVQEMGYHDLEDYQEWLAQASDADALASGWVLYALLTDGE